MTKVRYDAITMRASSSTTSCHPFDTPGIEREEIKIGQTRSGLIGNSTSRRVSIT